MIKIIGLLVIILLVILILLAGMWLLERYTTLFDCRHINDIDDEHEFIMINGDLYDIDSVDKDMLNDEVERLLSNGEWMQSLAIVKKYYDMYDHTFCVNYVNSILDNDPIVYKAYCEVYEKRKKDLEEI